MMLHTHHIVKNVLIKITAHYAKKVITPTSVIRYYFVKANVLQVIFQF